MRVVLDTNVLVAAALTPSGGAARLLNEYVFAEGAPLTVLVDERILDEYRDVLTREVLAFEPGRAARLVASIEAAATFLDDVPAVDEPISPDPDDQAFLEVALAGGADVIVTSNLKDFPDAGAVDVMKPGSLLRLLEDV